MTSTSQEVERDEFLDSLDTIIIESDSEVEIIEVITSRNRHKLKSGGLDEDLSFLDESSSDDEVSVVEQVQEKSSKKRFRKKREVKKTIKLTEQKASKCHKWKNQRRQGKKPVATIRENSAVNIQKSRSIQNFNTDTLPPNYLKILMIATYKDTIGQVHTWSDQGYRQNVPKHFK